MNRRPRPDCSAALKRAREHAAYTEFLRQGIQVARADPRPGLSRKEAAHHMGQVKAGLEARLDVALAGKKDTKE